MTDAEIKTDSTMIVQLYALSVYAFPTADKFFRGCEVATCVAANLFPGCNSS